MIGAGCDSPRCDGRKQVVTPEGYLCRECAAGLPGPDTKEETPADKGGC